MNRFIRASGTIMLLTVVAASRGTAQQPLLGARYKDLLIEDSLTPAKAQLRGYVAELRDSLVTIESVQARIVRARASRMTSVVVSQGRELSRNCLKGASMVGLTTKRIEPMNTPNPHGDQALQAFRSALSTLQEDLRLCAHFDSLTMAAAPLDQQKLENIATAAREAIERYNLVRNGLMNLIGISLPIEGTVWRP